MDKLQKDLENCMAIEDTKARWQAMAGIANLHAFMASVGAPPA